MPLMIQLMIANAEVTKPRYQRKHRRPAKPPKSARHKLLNHVGFGAAIGFGEKRSLNKIEVVQQADPRDAEQHVQPTQNEKHAVHCKECEIHV